MLTEVATMHDLLESVSLTGHVVPRTDAVADVLPPVAGRVTGSGLPQLGQRVNRGQVLFRVVQVLTPTERTSLRTEQARAKGDLSAAERDVARLEKLEGVVAGKQLTEARIRRDAAREVYNTVSAQLSGQGASVPVTAPISGEIVKAEIAEGEVVDGSRAVYQIADLSRVWVEANLFEKDVPGIQGATQAEIRIPSNPDEVFSGTLYKVGGTVDPESRTITALFLVDNRNARLKLNMTASIAVTTSHRSGVLAVPRGAIVRSGTRAVVFVHTTPEQFEVRDVVTGPLSSGDYVEVVQGLVAGERVLVNNTYQLKSAAGL
jgi:cobalt-zinc-cadmium efflux system membrane fusion protein